MANTYQSTDKLLEDYAYLSQVRKAKVDRYIKNLVRIEQAERGVAWAEKEVKREMCKIGAEDTDTCRCSFCGKSSDEVDRMIAGTGVYICSECIELCGEILVEEMNNPQ